VFYALQLTVIKFQKNQPITIFFVDNKKYQVVKIIRIQIFYKRPHMSLLNQSYYDFNYARAYCPEEWRIKYTVSLQDWTTFT
jgi:hypothetical protein